jgi:hypothetical protein
VLVLWQTQSATRSPDRVVAVVADVGTMSFSDPNSFASPTGAGLPPVALYMEQSGAMWLASSGNLLTSVAAAPESCPAPQAAFVASATCSLGTFGAVGKITFSPFMAAPGASGTHTLELTALTSIPGIVTNVSSIVTSH